MTYVLFNPLSDNGNGTSNAHKLDKLLKGENAIFLDLIETDPVNFIDTAEDSDKIIIAGGDGTIHKLVNLYGSRVPAHPVYYYPTGTGNDFTTELHETISDEIILLNPYIKNLPVITVNEKSFKFINGIGFGIDGFCCEEGDKQRKKTNKPINYPGIAIRGMLGAFKPRSARIVADGKKYSFKYVWLAPTMKGKYYGGGMKVAPFQDRMSENCEVTTIVFHCNSTLKTLMVFPSIFKGKHVEHKNIVEQIKAHDVKVTFDRPTPLQVDGETFTNVLSYSVTCPTVTDNGNNEKQTLVNS